MRSEGFALLCPPAARAPDSRELSPLPRASDVSPPKGGTPNGAALQTTGPLSGQGLGAVKAVGKVKGIGVQVEIGIAGDGDSGSSGPIARGIEGVR